MHAFPLLVYLCSLGRLILCFMFQSNSVDEHNFVILLFLYPRMKLSIHYVLSWFDFTNLVVISRQYKLEDP